LKIMISAWSPPAELKSNDSIRGGGTLKKKDGKYVYDEYANWWLESLLAYKAAGVDVDYVNIQNEPDYTAKWDSCLLEPTETNEIAGYDAAFEAVWQKLNKEMGTDMPKMLVADSSGLDRIDEYIDNIDDLSHVYGYAHHLYNCFGDGDDIPGCGAAPDRYITRMDEFRTDYGNKPRIQTEYEHEADTWEDAINSAITIHNFLTVEEGCAYLYWELFWGPSSGLVSLMDPNTIRINPVYYTFKNYSAYISSGWYRIGAENDNDDLKVSAYTSPDGKKATVVIINTSKDTGITAQLGLSGFEASDGKIYRSSETEKCEPVGKYESGAELKLPAYSVTTIVLWAK
ncbi:MAG: glycoside hydrolase family 30 beta sandwich domain-containing protein, partial [Phycisphaerae bacterium]